MATNTHGGSRPGSGRPKQETRKRYTMALRGTYRDRLEKIAHETKRSPSDLLRVWVERILDGETEQPKAA